MNLKKKLREAILEKTKRKYDYGCVMVNLNLDTKQWNKIQEMVDEDDIYFGENGDGGFGRELDPHVTVLYGIHDDVPDEDIEKLIKKIDKPDAKLTKVSAFKNKLFEVLKFDVESKDLHGLNKMFKKLPYTTEYPEYHPHATICYLKIGTVDKYVKMMDDLEPLETTTDKVIYSKPDGSKKNYDL